MHLKRNEIKVFWKVPKKGTKYLSVATHNKNESIPLIIVMREILGFVKTKKELKKALNEKKIKINNKIIQETNYPICLLDILFIEGLGNYKSTLSENKKMIFEKISEKEAENKIYKVLNKKVLKSKKIQINLSGGKNLITDKKLKIGDSVIVSFKDNKIEEILVLEKGKKVLVLNGKHMGKLGVIEEIVNRGGKDISKIKVGNDKMNVWNKNLIVVK